jgi:EcoRII C terminal
MFDQPLPAAFLPQGPPGSFANELRRIRREGIPSSEKIVAEAFEKLGYTGSALSPDEVRRRFDELLGGVWRKTLEVLEVYEERAYGEKAIGEVIRLHAEDLRQAREAMRADTDDAVALERAIQGLFRVWYPELRALFLSISQSRKSRGGKDFELQLRRLLELMEVPYQPPDRTHRVDFMIPSYEHYARNRNQCIVVSAKRTLRERWQEVVDELHKMNCPNVYLATADERISAEKKDDIWRRNIYLVVWDEVKRRDFPTDDAVVSYSHLAGEVIPHFARFWPKA